MPEHETRTNQTVENALRTARVIYRCTPPLRKAVEMEDWLQEAVLAVLSLPGEPSPLDVTRTLRALAKRHIRMTAKTAGIFRLPIETFDKLEAPVPAPAIEVDRKKFKKLPKSQRRRYSRVKGSRLRFGAGAVARLKIAGYPKDEIAKRFGVSVRTVERWLKRTLEEEGQE